ncbi:MBL fold metallo-hydrolase [Isoptericola variabilis]|uniref:Zn-dependent hydrolase, glyoxylase n=1 Tax=Isoptericola variabilis (strain 225) TaxID=743718 RepID=F6FSY1_ISOV2|nr:MBL fold metallo-hydrolase [Isoptericola variabilis]AEG43122.1 Zn-dependent hydrolase, glyoxylase [Isoptericola variabilis 225]TWH35051.1 glyoxylase-like metal-dependent hydrolase (beta-lactamase superfamily II) [Isoptericola variabilis J7]
MNALTPVTPFAAVLRADNPGPMTLDGTRSYVLRAPGAGTTVVVDPGPDDDAHLRALADAGPVGLVLVTHRHGDHTAGAARLHELTGAPVRAADVAHCHGGDELRPGEAIEAAGLRIEVVPTPGHTADSVSFHVTTPAEPPVVVTGDTVLGEGTTVISEPDGSLGDYLASLDVLEQLGDGVQGLPGHGPVVHDLGDRVRQYRAHRLERLEQVRAALRSLGVEVPDGGGPVPEGVAERVVEAVYDDVDESVLPAARQSVVAQLAYLFSPR